MSAVEVTETPLETEVLELDRRSGDGIEVLLAWEPRSNRVWLAVLNEHTDDEFCVEVDPARALDAFHHPFTYEPQCLEAELEYVAV